MGNPPRSSGNSNNPKVQASLDINLTGTDAANPKLQELVLRLQELQTKASELGAQGGLGATVAGDLNQLALLASELETVKQKTDAVNTSQREAATLQEKLANTKVNVFQQAAGLTAEDVVNQRIAAQLNRFVQNPGDILENQRDQFVGQGARALGQLSAPLEDILGSLGLDELKTKADGTKLSVSGLAQELTTQAQNVQQFLGVIGLFDDLGKAFEKYNRSIKVVQDFTEQAAESQAKEAAIVQRTSEAREATVQRAQAISRAEEQAAATQTAGLAVKEANNAAEVQNTAVKAQNTAATVIQGEASTATTAQTTILSGAVEFLGNTAKASAGEVAIGATNVATGLGNAATGMAGIATSAAAALVPLVAISALFLALDEGSKTATSPLTEYLDTLEKVDARQVDVTRTIREGGEQQLILTRRNEEAKLAELQRQIDQQQELQSQFREELTGRNITTEVLAILGIKKESSQEIVDQIGDFLDYTIFLPVTLLQEGIEKLGGKSLNPLQVTLDALGFDADESEKKVDDLNQQLEVVSSNVDALNASWAQSLAVTEDLIDANSRAYDVEKQREQLLALNSTASLNQQIRLNIAEQQNLTQWADANAEVLSQAIDRSLEPFNTSEEGFLARLNSVIDRDLSGGMVNSMQEFFDLQAKGLIAIQDVFQDNPLKASLDSNKTLLQSTDNSGLSQVLRNTLDLIANLDPGAKLEDQQTALEKVNTLLKESVVGFDQTFTNFGDLTTFLNEQVAEIAKNGTPEQIQGLQALQSQLSQFGVVFDTTIQLGVVTTDESAKRVQEEQGKLQERQQANADQAALLNEKLVRQVVTINEGIGKTEKELSTLASATSAQVDSQIASLQNQIQAREEALDQLRALYATLDPRSQEAQDLNLQIASIEVDLDGLVKQMEFWDTEVRKAAENRQKEAEAQALENKRQGALERLTDELDRNADALDKAQGELEAYNAELDKQAQRQATRDDFNARIAAAQALEAEQGRQDQIKKVQDDALKAQGEQLERYTKTQSEQLTQYREAQGEKETRYQESTLKAQEDFNLRRLRAQQDLDDKLLQAVENNDVRSFIQAQREADKRFSREDEDFDKQTSERVKAREKELEADRVAFEKRQQQAREQFEEQAQAQTEATTARVQQIIASGVVEVKESQKLRDELAKIEAAWREEDKQLQEAARRDQLNDRITALQEEGDTLLDIQAFYAQQQIDVTQQMYEAITKMGFSAAEVLQLAGNQADQLKSNIAASLSVGTGAGSGGNVGNLFNKVKNFGFFAEGGVAREPTFAVLGEDPNAYDVVTPVPKGSTFINELSRLGIKTGGDSTSSTIIQVDMGGVTVGKFADQGDLDRLEGQVYNTVERAIHRAAGALS